jgi:hypothetical protein
MKHKNTPAVRADPGYEAALADVVGLVAAARANLFQAAVLSRPRLDNRAGHVRQEESGRRLAACTAPRPRASPVPGLPTGWRTTAGARLATAASA